MFSRNIREKNIAWWALFMLNTAVQWQFQIILITIDLCTVMKIFLLNNVSVINMIFIFWNMMKKSTLVRVKIVKITALNGMELVVPPITKHSLRYSIKLLIQTNAAVILLMQNRTEHTWWTDDQQSICKSKFSLKCWNKFNGSLSCNMNTTRSPQNANTFNHVTQKCISNSTEKLSLVT